MKTYLRIISFSKRLPKAIPLYLFVTVFAVIFGVANFALLKPLFDVIFQQVDAVSLAAYTQKPNFELTADYFTAIFNYYLLEWMELYGKAGALYFVCGIIVVSVFLANFFTYLSAIILANVRAELVQNIRVTAYKKMSRLHAGFFSDNRKGDLISKITNDIQEIENSIVASLRILFKEPFTIIAFFAVLFFMSVKLTLFTLVLIPISGFIISSITKRLKKKATESQTSLGRIVNILDETIGGIRIIKAFNALTYMRNIFSEESSRYAKINVSMAKKNELASPLSQFMGVSVVAGILAYGGTMVLQNTSELTASEFITYIILFSQVLNPFKAISNSLSNIQRGLASAERVFELIDTESMIKNNPNPILLTDFKDRIKFQNIHFSYEEEPVLKGVSFEIKKGQTVALVGPSGGGKSTLADLLPRFYDPKSGQISIDGVSLRDIELSHLRRLIGIVTQESILFNDTIAANIAFGEPLPDMKRVKEAAKIANAVEFIEQSPQGYQTLIGDRGEKLSGGQKQRLSIARAVYKNPPILILDEATSALDSESERLVQDALSKLMKNRTSLVIAHRLSTIQSADLICVLQKGEIVEKDTHDNLLQQDGVYSKLIAMQSL
ncbi:MAG: ABC transporter ATP-binding protein/permease [Cyclobacteriaceae bacterium]|nr:ABC transporter ATP-binding protein [Cyclobacteriaceae bacterium]MCH8517655.1 ABC transporter ATP-binding protein/permease [Cyclobacteriaceae bacterium]